MEGFILIKLQNAVAAFLLHDGHYLLILRSKEKKIAPGVWSGIGGKLEQNELNEPEAACLREIEEETGITAEHIHDLKLRYIIIRRTEDTIRQSYIYFGKTAIQTFTDTDEGKLYWISESELLNRTFTKTFELMLKHFTIVPDTERVVVGVAENGGGQCHMTWSAVEDFE